MQSQKQSQERSKNQLRKDLLTQRRQISYETWRQQSINICDRLGNWQIFQQAQNILAFSSFRQEPDLSYLWQRFPKKNWGFPRCIDKDLCWHQVAIADFENSMQIGAFGILEPLDNLPYMALKNIDLVLIPAVACDRRGYRLGYGGGFYDRWLPQSLGIKIGVIFNQFYLNEIPQETWDIPMDIIATNL